MTEKSNFSFKDFFMPQVGGSVSGASHAIEKGDHEYADQCLNAAEYWLERAKEQTEKQIADRDAGTYDPDKYLEDMSKLEEVPEKDVKFPEPTPWWETWKR